MRLQRACPRHNLGRCRHWSLGSTGEQASTSSSVLSKLENVPNVRDLAQALPSLKPGRLLRCANPCGATPADLDLLFGALNVRDLIDLRAPQEVEEDMCTLIFTRGSFRRFERALWSNTLHVQETWVGGGGGGSGSGGSSSSALSGSAAGEATGASSSAGSGGGAPIVRRDVARSQLSLLDRGRFFLHIMPRLPLRVQLAAAANGVTGNRDAARDLVVAEINKGGLPLLYEVILETSKPELAQAMRIVLAAAEASHALLFFCKAGKDRTGIVAALLLSCLGAPDAAILDDYALSDAYHKVALAGMENRPELRGLDRAKFERAPREALASALAHLRSKYGSAEAYLESIGFSRAEQQRLRAACLKVPQQPPPAAGRGPGDGASLPSSTTTAASSLTPKI